MLTITKGAVSFSKLNHDVSEISFIDLDNVRCQGNRTVINGISTVSTFINWGYNASLFVEIWYFSFVSGHSFNDFWSLAMFKIQSFYSRGIDCRQEFLLSLEDYYQVSSIFHK